MQPTKFNKPQNNGQAPTQQEQQMIKPETNIR